MSMPFYVAPEQVMKDRADYARNGMLFREEMAFLKQGEPFRRPMFRQVAGV